MLLTALTVTYVCLVTTRNMLSMLLLLVAAYVLAALWLISHSLLYTGLLYVLVYVGAIVVLIIFVVQLTNTSLTTSTHGPMHRPINLIVNLVLLAGLCFIALTNLRFVSAVVDASMTEALLSLSQTSPTADLAASYSDATVPTQPSSLPMLASSLFNEYAYVLVISVHAIVLAIIGPIKLALADLS